MGFNLTGTGVAIVTPFNDDLSIDFGSMEKMINHTIAGKLDYIAIMGTTGEPATLSLEEKKELLAFSKKCIAGRVPLVVGIGGYNTAEVISLINEFDLKGVSAILSVSPYYNKPSQEGIYAHYKALSEASPLPIIVYNVPGRTGSNIEARTIIRLANDCPNLLGVKEASGNMGQIMQILKNKPASFQVISGDDALTLPMISLGAEGVISVIANSHPEAYSNLVNHALKGEFKEATKIQLKIIDYIDALFVEGSPSCIKAALEIAGLCKKHVRLPLTPVSDGHYSKLQELINEIS